MIADSNLDRLLRAVTQEFGDCPQWRALIWDAQEELARLHGWQTVSVLHLGRAEQKKVA